MSVALTPSSQHLLASLASTALKPTPMLLPICRRYTQIAFRSAPNIARVARQPTLSSTLQRYKPFRLRRQVANFHSSSKLLDSGKALRGDILLGKSPNPSETRRLGEAIIGNAHNEPDILTGQLCSDHQPYPAQGQERSWKAYEFNVVKGNLDQLDKRAEKQDKQLEDLQTRLKEDEEQYEKELKTLTRHALQTRENLNERVNGVEEKMERFTNMAEKELDKLGERLEDELKIVLQDLKTKGEQGYSELETKVRDIQRRQENLSESIRWTMAQIPDIYQCLNDSQRQLTGSMREMVLRVDELEYGAKSGYQNAAQETSSNAGQSVMSNISAVFAAEKAELGAKSRSSSDDVKPQFNSEQASDYQGSSTTTSVSGNAIEKKQENATVEAELKEAKKSIEELKRKAKGEFWGYCLGQILSVCLVLGWFHLGNDWKWWPSDGYYKKEMETTAKHVYQAVNNIPVSE